MEEVVTDDAPDALGPYSQGTVSDGKVYVSGQGPIDPATGEVESDDVTAQTERTLENVGAILEAGGSSLDSVVKANVYLTDMDDYEAVNEAYASFFSEPYPARAAVEVVELPIDIKVEIEAIGEVE